jgi:hypothetical protein
MPQDLYYKIRHNTTPQHNTNRGNTKEDKAKTKEDKDTNLILRNFCPHVVAGGIILHLKKHLLKREKTKDKTKTGMRQANIAL